MSLYTNPFEADPHRCVAICLNVNLDVICFGVCLARLHKLDVFKNLCALGKKREPGISHSQSKPIAVSYMCVA